MSESSLVTALRKRPWFAQVPEQHLATLAAQAVRRQLEPQEICFIERQPSAGLWLVESGTIKIYKLSAGGHEHILRLCGPGDTFNDIPAIDGRPNAASAAAISAALVWVIPTSVLAHAMTANHELALALVQGLTHRIRGLVGQVEDLALRSVTSRLARFLLAQADNPNLSSPAVTRALIANHLATTPESVSRALRTLEEQGAIQFDRHRIVIQQVHLLREIAML